MRAVVTSIALACGCYSPHYATCRIACGAGCPSGLTCDDTMQLCSADPTPGACAALLDAGREGTTPDAAGPFAQRAYVKPNNTAMDYQFGWSVALSADGSTLAVGALDESSHGSKAGAVYVYVRSGDMWSFQAYITDSTISTNDEFGTSVALSADGSRLAVGSIFEATTGAVFIFDRAGGAWSRTAEITAGNPGGGDEFGSMVALSGDGLTLAVGAVFEDGSATGIDGTPDDAASNAGAAYVFVDGASAWTQQAYVKASNTGADDGFGLAVALSADGSTLAVGARDEDSASTDQTDNSASSAGAVYVFTRSGVTWSQQAYVKPSNPRAGDQFGSAVALSGDGATLAVGSRGGSGDAGAAYVFARSGVTWAQQQIIFASNIGAGDEFAHSLSLSADGSLLVAGAWVEDGSAKGIDAPSDDLANGAGAAYLFKRSGTTWSQRHYIKASNTDPNDVFGESVAVSADGSTLAVGATSEASAATGVDGNQSDNSTMNAGAVYVFR